MILSDGTFDVDPILKVMSATVLTAVLSELDGRSLFRIASLNSNNKRSVDITSAPSTEILDKNWSSFASQPKVDTGSSLNSWSTSIDMWDNLTRTRINNSGMIWTFQNMEKKRADLKSEKVSRSQTFARQDENLTDPFFYGINCCGLKNLQNSCHMNAGIQCIYIALAISDEMINVPKYVIVDKVQQHNTLKELFVSMTRSCPADVLEPFQLYELLNKHYGWTPHRQRDLGETMTYLMTNCYILREETIFDVYTEETLTCSICDSQKAPINIQDTGIFLHVKEFQPIKQRTIQELLLTYFTSDASLVEPSRCVKCNANTRHSRTRSLQIIPKTFFISVQRIKFDVEEMKFRNRQNEQYFGSLNREHLLVEDCVYLPFEDKKVFYTLVAFSMHSGTSVQHGHWSAAIKKGTNWTLCNDSHLTNLNSRNDMDKKLHSHWFFVRSDVVNVYNSKRLLPNQYV